MISDFSRVIFGWFCGYLFIRWMPITFPFRPSDLVVEFVLNPIEFFAASIAFIIGFLFNAAILRFGVERSIFWTRYKKINIWEFLFLCIFLGGFVFLFWLSFLQALAFFSFTVIYGMISLDINSLKHTGE